MKSTTKSRPSLRSAEPTGSKPAKKGRTAPVQGPKTPKPGKAQSAAKRPTRADEVVELLRRKNGATIEEMVRRFGIQPPSIRATISVESRKRGLKVEQVGKAHYRLAP